jgi:hypothetical protein
MVEIKAPNEVTVNLPRDLLQELKALSELMGVPAEEAMRYAIGTTYYIQEQRKQGNTIVVKKQDGKFYEVEWKNDPKPTRIK